MIFIWEGLAVFLLKLFLKFSLWLCLFGEASINTRGRTVLIPHSLWLFYQVILIITLYIKFRWAWLILAHLHHRKHLITWCRQRILFEKLIRIPSHVGRLPFVLLLFLLFNLLAHQKINSMNESLDIRFKFLLELILLSPWSHWLWLYLFPCCLDFFNSL